MKQAKDEKIYCYVDESGDPVFTNRKGKNLIESNEASPVFMVGHLETQKPTEIARAFQKIRDQISIDDYLQGIPSVKKSLKHFHAKDDCPEVRQEVFKAIRELDFKAFVIVARKNPVHFNNKFNKNKTELYKYLVSKLFENRLHLYTEMDIYFSKMGNIVREKNMLEALNAAKHTFESKWASKNKGEFKISIQEPSEIIPLQTIDYVLWAVYRVFVKDEMRYYNYIKDKISFIVDIFDVDRYGGSKNMYTPDRPLERSPLIKDNPFEPVEE